MGAGQAPRQLLTTETQEHCVPRTTGALPATHGGDTVALHASASPAETGAPKGGQGLCLLCRDAGLPPIQCCRDMAHCRDAGLPPIQRCRDTGHPGHRRDAGMPPVRHCRDMGHCGAATHPALQGHRALKGCRAVTQQALQGHGARQGRRAAAHPALQGHGAVPGYRATCHPSLQGFRALPAVQEYSPSITAGTQGSATAGTEQHCPPCTANTAALPASHCEMRRHHPSGTAGMQEPRASSVLHCTQGTAIHLCPSQKEGRCPALYWGNADSLPTLHGSADVPRRAEPPPPQGAAALHSPGTLRWEAQHLPSAAQSLGNPTPCASKYCSLPSLQTHCSFPLPPTPGWDTARTHWVPTQCQRPPHPLQRQCQQHCPPALQRHTLHTLHRRHPATGNLLPVCTHCRGSARRIASPIETIPFCSLSPRPCLVLCLATRFPVTHFQFWEHTLFLRRPGAPTQHLPSREGEGEQPRSLALRKPSGWMP